MVLVVVGRSGNALHCASEDLKADKEAVLVAVGQDGDALQFASEDPRRALG